MANQAGTHSRSHSVVFPGRLRRGRAGAHPRALEYAVVDVETTGLHPDADARVCEIAVVRMRGDGTVLTEFCTLVDPLTPVAGREFHGIGDADVRDAPRTADLVDDLARLFSGAVVVGHNLEFEERFLAAECAPAGLAGGLPGLCTLTTLRAQMDLDRYSLPRVSHALAGRWPGGQHTALGDARATAQLLAELLHNAPAPLSYLGPEPRTVPTDGSRERRLKPRQAGVGHGAPRLPGTDRAGAGSSSEQRLALARWPGRWRPIELEPASCTGSFRAPQREAAVAAATARSQRHTALTTAAAWAAGAASAGMVVLGTRNLSGWPMPPG